MPEGNEISRNYARACALFLAHANQLGPAREQTAQDEQDKRVRVNCDASELIICNNILRARTLMSRATRCAQAKLTRANCARASLIGRAVCARVWASAVWGAQLEANKLERCARERERPISL